MKKKNEKKSTVSSRLSLGSQCNGLKVNESAKMTVK